MTALHKLLLRQLAKATQPGGEVDLAVLTSLVSDAYEAVDRDRRRVDRSNALMTEELDELNASLQELIAKLETQNLRFEAALDNMLQGLCLFDRDGRLIVCNRRFCEIYSLPEADRLAGRSLPELLALSPVSDAARRDQHLACAAGRERVTCHQDLSDGRAIVIAHEPLRDGGFVETFEDVTERRRAEARIAHMAHYDALTDLPNRVLFRERLEHALDRVGRGENCAILYLDLDQFKAVNDSLGHACGDALLRAVSQRIRRAVRQIDTVARLGGDEFAIIQSGIEKPADAVTLASRLIEELGAPYVLEGHHATVAASVGISLAPADGSSADQLLRNADLALYRAKADGRGCYRFFEAQMDAQMRGRLAMEQDLSRALGAEEFELHYQPLIQIRTKRISGFEALLRWHRAGGDLVAPDRFIPLAEETGLIVPIGAWVLRTACAEAARWPGPLTVAVNLSAVQFKKGNLVDAVRAALEASGLPPARLELEVTESVMIDDPASALEILRQLQAIGVSIAMDDFGTGYSSLSQLRSFPFNKVKIDQSFVRELQSRPHSIAIVRAVTGMCNSLGIATTGEGVETMEQLAMLGSEGCTEAQGYLFSKPKPACEIPSFLAEFDRVHLPVDPVHVAAA